ncbi:MAG: rRNA (adenine1518-N6/adenine1519-N6)-dimethyltransferase [Actinomycetota bacterium]|nr:rRNA (adenine1518-N6/adenine1519-N6)-dimethyltransferase [Actinomycetota bacterium]
MTRATHREAHADATMKALRDGQTGGVDLLTPASIQALLDKHGVRPGRALGQNFLADPNTARRIVRLAGVEARARVVEIGPGLGSLTLALADAGASEIVALELDRHLVPVLREVLEGRDVRIETGDALSIDWRALLGDAPGWSMVSNLPYNVATPLVVRVLENAPMVERLFVMVQREVGERMAAAPGTDAYGAVSVKIAYYARAELAGVVPPTVFMPKPAVDSALVRIVRREQPPVDVPDVDRLFVLVRAGFATRRKMLRRALTTELGIRTIPVLEAAGIDPSVRAETLGLEEWASIARVEADTA